MDVYERFLRACVQLQDQDLQALAHNCLGIAHAAAGDYVAAKPGSPRVGRQRFGSVRNLICSMKFLHVHSRYTHVRTIKLPNPLGCNQETAFARLS